jgi:multiple sugar transport system substrate-binding protein
VLWNYIFEDWNKAWCEQQAAAFNKESKTVELDQQFVPGDGWDEKMKAAQASGTAPDIYLINYAKIPYYARDGLILALNDYIPRSAWNDLYDNVKGFVSYKGKYYAYPQLVEPATVLYYRTDLFKAAGLDPAKPPKTWDQYIEYAKKLAKGDVFGSNFPAFGGEIGWTTWGWQYTAAGHLAISDDWSKATVTDQGYVDLVNFVKRLYTEKAVPAQMLGGYNDIRPFAEGGYAMAFCGSWAIGQLRNTFPDVVDKVAVAAPPTKDGKPFHSTVGGWTYVIDAKSKVAKAAGEYIYWLLGDDAERPASFFAVAQYSKYAPRKSVDTYIKKKTEASKDPWMKVVSEQITPYAIAEPLYAWDICMAVDNAIENAVLKNMSAEDALAKAAEAINTFIKNNDYASKKP